MIIGYDLSENEEEEYLICDACGSMFNDTAELNTEKKTVQIHIPSCFGSINEVLPLQEFLDDYESNLYHWPDEPFYTLIRDVKDLL